MNKKEFIAQLRKETAGLPREALEERLSFYCEMIDDRMEEGLSEEEAVAQLGPVDEIAAQITADIPLSHLVKERVKPTKALRAWEIALLALGSPIWASLLIALAAVIISVYAVLWSVIISLWAIQASLITCAAAGVVACAVLAARGRLLSAVALLGAGLICGGLAIFGHFGCKYVTGAILRLTKQLYICIKSRFVKKETAQ